MLPLTRKNTLTGRAELVDKDELFDTVPELASLSFRIGAYTLGYSRDLGAPLKVMQTALGANASLYSLPAVITPYYGNRPWGVDVFLRIRLKQPH